jgi:motility quorum-sensing regulator/GCU-specific mRNA interferase toxin
LPISGFVDATSEGRPSKVVDKEPSEGNIAVTEKWKPHHDLASIQAMVRTLGPRAFTKRALDGGRALGLTTADMVSVIETLSIQDFYKSMTTYHDHTVWQDVYHAPTPVGIESYIKVMLRDGQPVIQFKER